MGPIGLPRRNLCRFVSFFASSLVSEEERLAGALAAGASFWVFFFWSAVLSSFFSSGLGLLGEETGGLVEVAGGVADGLDPVDAGAVDVAAGAALDVVPLFVKRGGASVASIPLGTTSAFIPFFGASAPAATHAPVASHGTSALAARLCSALLIVKRPNSVPVFSPSYTMPDSSAMGTGSAL